MVGRGLAGCAAALELAEAGHQVRLLAAGPGATALCGGSLDVAAASPGVPHLPWRDPLRGTALAATGRLGFLLSGAGLHPYTRLHGSHGQGALIAAAAEAIEKLRGWLAPSQLGVEGDLGRNRLLPTAVGTLRITDHALSGPAEADLTGCSRVLVADLPGLEGWDARGCARTLVHEIEALGLGPMQVEVVALRRPLTRGAEGAARVAARLDGPEGDRFLAEALEGIGGTGDVVLLPQVVGLRRTRELLRGLASSGRRVGEVIAFPPHALAGYRLQCALDAALEAAGIEVIRGRAGRVRIDGGCYRIDPAAGQPFPVQEADALVLATGRFVGGGLVAGPEGVREPLLGLPLSDPDGRRVDGIPAHRSVRKGYGNPQPLYAAGVSVDAELRPASAPGRALWAAGEWIGGFDPARERTGLGTALITGLAAGRRAASHLGANGS